jgi:hypothetical protein
MKKKKLNNYYNYKDKLRTIKSAMQIKLNNYYKVKIK